MQRCDELHENDKKLLKTSEKANTSYTSGAKSSNRVINLKKIDEKWEAFKKIRDAAKKNR